MVILSRLQIEVLSEDSSSIAVLRALIPAMLAEVAVLAQIAYRPHRGKGYWYDDTAKRPQKLASGLLELLPAKCRAYAKAGGVDLLLVVLDADADDPNRLYRQMEAVVRRFAPSLPFVFGIAVEEMESWLLGDRAAILAAYPTADVRVLNHYHQDSIVGTWEVLCRSLYGHDARQIMQAGYPVVGQYKHEWASAIAGHLDARRNKSASFQRFRETLLRIAKERSDVA